MASSPVVFDYSGWLSRFPEFQNISQATAQLYFNEACLYLDNTACSPVQDTTQRSTLLNLATAHIAALNTAPSGSSTPSSLVGRVDQASVGSVSVHADMPDQPHSAAWWQQTRYGASFWAATAQYRLARFRTADRNRLRDRWFRGF